MRADGERDEPSARAREGRKHRTDLVRKARDVRTGNYAILLIQETDLRGEQKGMAGREAGGGQQQAWRQVGLPLWT